MEHPLWEPTLEQKSGSNLVRFTQWLNEVRPKHYPNRIDLLADDVSVSWERLYRWSIEHNSEFWSAWACYIGLIADSAMIGSSDHWDDVGVGLERMAPPDPDLGPRWFPFARLNFAENLLRQAEVPGADEEDAIVQWDEAGPVRSLSYSELLNQVRATAQALTKLGVGQGTRVAAMLPNIAEAVIAMLATASLGAIWTSCSPDFGVLGVLDRFRQVDPDVLFTAPAYRYGGKVIDVQGKLERIFKALPGLKQIVLVDYPSGFSDKVSFPKCVSWDDFITRNLPNEACEYLRLPFNHPLYIMYSSGTTGLPKCIVHGSGGTLLQHLKELALHSDVKPGDRVFYFTTCGWMMWNWLVSSLALGATLVLFDGNPLKPDPQVLWRMAENANVTHFGTSAKYLALLEKQGVKPGKEFELGKLRVILSTGSPLAPESFDYVYREIKQSVQLASISGGTDIISCFALGNPIAPVYRGQLQTRGLGMAVEVWNENEQPVNDEPGELVCVKPFPSMPVTFWNDPDNSKYHHAYFTHFPGVWRHGDWAQLTEQDGLIIHGRSDATLNPGGVRIGTAEIYQQVEAFPEIIESIAIGQDWKGDTRIVLFVRMSEGVMLTSQLEARLCSRIREQCSPHHVPRKIIAVADIPRTINGKLSEAAVRAVVQGHDVTNRDALMNPNALGLFADLPELAE